MKREYDFNIVKCGLINPANAWTPPLSTFEFSKNDEREKYASLIADCFEECGADCEGIDENFDTYEENIGEELYKDPFENNPLFNTDAKVNGAKALASNLTNRYSSIDEKQIVELVTKIYSFQVGDMTGNPTVSCYF